MGNEVSVCGPKDNNKGPLLGPGPIDYSVKSNLASSQPAANMASANMAYTTPQPTSLTTESAESSQDLLHKAAASGSISILQSMISAKRAPVDCTDDKGNTALHKAAWHGKLESVRLLMRHGAKASLLNSTGKTPLAFAQQMGHAEVADYISEMLQRHSPEKIKSMFRSKGKTSNCVKVFGPRQSMKATAWLIPGAPEVAEIREDEKALDNAIAAAMANQQITNPTTATTIAPTTPYAMRTTSAEYAYPSPMPPPRQHAKAAALRTTSSPATPAPAPVLPGHQLPPSAVCSVNSTPAARDQWMQQVLYSQPQQSPADRKSSPFMPKLDLSTVNGAKLSDEEMLSGRSTSRREDFPENMWSEEMARAASSPSGNKFASPRFVPVERCVQAANGQVKVVQLARTGLAVSRAPSMPVPRSPSFALV